MDAWYSPMDNFTSTVVGTSYPGLVRRSGQRLCSRNRGRRHRAIWRQNINPWPRRSGHMVFVWSVAIFNIRLARWHIGIEKILSNRPVIHRRRHYLFLGCAYDYDGHIRYGRCTIPDCEFPRPGSRFQGTKNVQDQRQRHRPINRGW